MKSRGILLLRLSSFYFKEVWKEIPFKVTVASGMALMFAFVTIAKGSFEAEVLPTTVEVLNIIRRFQPVVFVVLALYSGELINKDRAIKINSLLEVLPYSTGFKLASQILALCFVLVSLLLLFMLMGIITQLSLGFSDINITYYFTRLFTEVLFNGLFIIILAFCIHTLVNHKFLGHGILIFLVIAQSYLTSWGLEHRLFHYAKLSLGPYSDLIGFQNNSSSSFFWYSLYWLGISIILYAITKLFVIRGLETGLKSRLRIARQRLGWPLIITSLVGCFLLVSSGLTIFKNTVIINDYKSIDKLEQYMATYEKLFKPYEGQATPEVIDVRLDIDLYPLEDNYNLKGQFTMINSKEEAISQIYVQGNFDNHITTKDIDFNRKFSIIKSSEKYKNTFFEFDEPLMPGDSLEMTFTINYGLKGFAQVRRSYLPQSATFFTNDHLPELGYRADFELKGTPKRAKYGLKPRQRERDINDEEGYTIGLHHGHNIMYEAHISTKEKYWAATSGKLKKQWIEDGRAHFEYKTEKPIENQFVVLTGKFDNIQTSAISGEDSVDLQLFYHPTHTYNLDAIMDGMKSSIEYFSKVFSPYKYDELKLLEIPRIHDFAISVPNTIAFSEAMGFVLENNDNGFNVPFFITAHEVAHQWWGDKVRAARVQGEGMIVETLAHYSAAIVTLQEFGEESLEHIVKYERGRYLKGRKSESDIEQPLSLAEDQSYIHYGKGLLNMMTLRHYISEAKINSALRRIIRDFPPEDKIYPNTEHLLGSFREVTPDSLQYLISDLFEKIVFMENGIVNAKTEKTANGSYQVEATFATEKLEANSKGTLNKSLMNDYIEVAIYSENKVIYRDMHRFDKDLSEMTFEVKERPTKIVIDPLFLLMDRDLDNNTWKFN